MVSEPWYRTGRINRVEYQNVQVKLDIASFRKTRVLVVGDVMLDRYWSGSASRISPEAPVPVVHVETTEERPGGAANVALNIAALGARPDLIGIVGDDEPGRAIAALLGAQRVSCHLQQASNVTTSTKLRILSQHQQLLRADFEASLGNADHKSIEDTFCRLIETADVVILSDYGKGTLANPRCFIEMAKSRGKSLLVDPKGRDFSRYRGATLITPNRGEFEAVVGPCATQSELVDKAETLMQAMELDALLITRGEEGMTLLCRGEEAHQLATRAREVYDVTGAGDTVIGSMAVALGSGYQLRDAATLANLAAGIVVGKLGTATVSAMELERALQGRNEGGFGILDEDQLLQEVRLTRRRGERIVMTNGCFDLLHSGHVTYLEQAKRLGDRLIVAVNSDASVRRLKGPDRPITTLAQRMAVLVALRAVDWVIAFTESTPERLYCRVLPDILVKGGDYKPEEIAGGDCVTRNGGQVVVLNYIDGQSTSAIIKRIDTG